MENLLCFVFINAQLRETQTLHIRHLQAIMTQLCYGNKDKHQPHIKEKILQV